MNIQIRRLFLSDIKALRQISRHTFAESFSSLNSKENMRLYLKNSFSAGKLKSELSNDCSEFYAAELGQQIIGYLKINFGQAQTELKDKNALEVERIFVLNTYQRQNVGQQLLEKSLEIARQRSVEYVWLGVWEKNQGAIRFYERNGFISFDSHFFKLGNDRQTDIMMKLMLK